ncbi:MAG: nuclear transport factor 2 family protein [Limnobacter sp.]|nr:nuclear transport factor 2 family protein [Limnobacter sp.]
MTAKNKPAPLKAEDLTPAVVDLIHFFEHLSPQAVDDLDRHYASDAFFKDPFNEVTGVPAIKTIFSNMFEQVDNPRFEVHHAIEQNGQVFLAWHFLFEMKRFKKGEVQQCRGSSHLQLNEQGQVAFHRDYWDTAEELYEKIPVLGALMRWLRKQAG